MEARDVMEISNRDRRWFWLVCLGLTLGVLAALGAAIGCDFIGFDDPDYVSENLHVQAGLTWSGLVWAFSTGHASNWHPLTWLSHMMDCQVYGLWAGGHHLTNLLLHAATTLLLFGWLRRWTGAFWRSAMVAALFGWHPLHVESVVWVAERKDVLSGLFWMLTLWAYGRYAEESKVQSSRSKVFYAGALGCFALGLMAKPMVVTLPFVLLLLDAWPLERRQPGRVARLLVEKLPFLLLALVSSVVTFLVQREGGSVQSISRVPLLVRVENALVAYGRYLGKWFWPVDLTVFYPRPDHWPVVLMLFALSLLAGITVLALARRKSLPWLAFGWFWFLGTLVPVIGLVQVGEQSMADRYMYLPSIGLLVAVVWGACHLTNRWQSQARLGSVAATTVLGLCAVVTFRQVGYWKNTETLFTHALAVTRNNYVACWQLGDYYAEHHLPARAEEMYRKAMGMVPGLLQVENNLGKLLLGENRVDEAMEIFQRVLNRKGDYPRARNNLGVALYRKGRIPDAVQEVRKAIQLDPDYGEARINLGNMLVKLGQVDEGIAELRLGTKLKPSDADAHFNLATLLENKGLQDEAVQQFQEAVRWQPNDADARNCLGVALSRKGRLDEAIPQFEEALRIDPQSAEAHCNFGIVLAAKGRRPEAISHFNQALKLQPDSPVARNQLQALTGSATRQ